MLPLFNKFKAGGHKCIVMYIDALIKFSTKVFDKELKWRENTQGQLFNIYRYE